MRLQIFWRKKGIVFKTFDVAVTLNLAVAILILEKSLQVNYEIRTANLNKRDDIVSAYADTKIAGNLIQSLSLLVYIEPALEK